MDSCQHIILSLLRNLGTSREVSRYLDLFSSEDRACSVLVKIGGGTLRDQLPQIASALALLNRVGLRVVVVHGGGPQLDSELSAMGIESPKIGGVRVTTPEILAVARRVFTREGERLASALEELSVRTKTLPLGVFEAGCADPELGLVGAISDVNADRIIAALDRGHIPVISSLGESAGGQILNINADTATQELAVALKPQKVVFLTPTGGLLDEHGEIVPSLDLSHEGEQILSAPWVHGGMGLKLQEIKGILDRVDVQCSVSITSADHLARELFTHRGDGTLIRRGTRIESYTSLDSLDALRLTALLEESFGKSLLPGMLEEVPLTHALLAGDYKALALLTDCGGVSYLDKFAVTAEAQGAGVGASLWSRLTEVAPRLVWRSNPSNPINPWYVQRADGMFRAHDWIVFWRGISDAGTVERCVQHALEQPVSFSTESGLAAKEHARV